MKRLLQIIIVLMILISCSEHNKTKIILTDTHINHIVDTYRKFNIGELKSGVVEDKFSYVATFEEIQENDFNLNNPRYVDTFEEEAEVDIAAVQKEIESLESELEDVQVQMDTYLKELMD